MKHAFVQAWGRGLLTHTENRLCNTPPGRKHAGVAETRYWGYDEFGRASLRLGQYVPAHTRARLAGHAIRPAAFAHRSAPPGLEFDGVGHQTPREKLQRRRVALPQTAR